MASKVSFLVVAGLERQPTAVLSATTVQWEICLLNWFWSRQKRKFPQRTYQNYEIWLLNAVKYGEYGIVTFSNFVYIKWILAESDTIFRSRIYNISSCHIYIQTFNVFRSSTFYNIFQPRLIELISLWFLAVISWNKN